MTTRVPLSTNDILSSSSNNEEDESYYSKIPILKRRLRATNNKDNATKKDPICVIVVGMAGSGKTTLMAQLQKSLSLRENDEDVSFLCIAQFFV